jgi:hypothetical protein
MSHIYLKIIEIMPSAIQSRNSELINYVKLSVASCAFHTVVEICKGLVGFCICS